LREVRNGGSYSLMRTRTRWLPPAILCVLVFGCSGEDKQEAAVESEPTVPRPDEYVEPQALLETPEPSAEPMPTSEGEELEPSAEPGAPPPAPPPEPEVIPPNPNVHPGWSRAGVTCAGEGLACGQCDDTTICFFSEPAACVPRADDDSFTCGVGALVACDASRPYCVSQTCMTLAEASCFCTAQPGDTAAACEADPSAAL
jgi:hypothetical protein